MQLGQPEKALRQDWRISLPNNEFGDFQTPLPLARWILKTLRQGSWDRVLEPTCGSGSFLQAAAALQAKEMLGIEVQAGYASQARTFAPVLERDIFELDLGHDLEWKHDGSLLVIGNPPWVTNAELTRLDSANLPIKSNIRNLSGMAAMTGASNFDIAEYIWLKLIAELQEQEPTIALLCKTQVARNVLTYCADFGLPIASSTIHLIDARRWFGSFVDACLFTVVVEDGAQNYVCDVYERLPAGLGADRPSHRFGVLDGRMVADVDAYQRSRQADGRCQFEWRQGIKHDASSVMELVEQEGPRTKEGIPVDVEEEYLFPLLKSSDLFNGRTGLSTKWMLVPQQSLTDDTGLLATNAPRLWDYLNANAAALDGRKSAIYRRRPRFCVFGVGSYSFTPYKVAISGMYKKPRFRVVGPIGSKPAVFDDTCYFLAFDRADDAAIGGALLQSTVAHDLLSALVFWDSKRPVTKKLLQRVDLAALAQLCDAADVVKTAQLNMDCLPESSDSFELKQRLDYLKGIWSKPEDDSVKAAEGVLFA
jgi:hypothetical protein